MVLLFLYHRLHHTAKRQLESLKRYDYATLEKLTLEREGVTRDLCHTIEGLDDEQGAETISEPVRRKIHELTSTTILVIFVGIHFLIIICYYVIHALDIITNNSLYLNRKR